MTARSARASLAFSCLGHLYSHVFEPIFYIAALVLPGELGLPYEDVLALVIAGKLLYGLMAPVAGWLGDRWSTVGMMAVFFLGLGASALSMGLAQGPWGIAVALALMGLFGSIYHPVGIAWLIRNAVDKGKAIGLNGVFGGVGPGIASLVAGALIAGMGWRAAFVLPGALVLLTGAAFVLALAKGWVIEAKADRAPQAEPSKSDAWRAGLVLSLTMLCAGLIYQATQPSLPKLFEERLGSGTSVGDAAFAVTVVYLVAGFTQIAAGHLADRFPAKAIYVTAALVQAVMLVLLSWASGWSMVGVALLAVAGNMGAIPAENLLLAKYTPARWRGTAFGLKFVLSFGVSGLAVPLVSLLRGLTGGFELLFCLLAGCAVVVAGAAMLLPREKEMGEDVEGATATSSPAPAGAQASAGD
ncbi:MAG: MFS transporter [Bacteroidota bacterium]